MNDGKTQQTDFRLADPAQFARNMAKVFEQAAHIARSFAEARPDPAARHGGTGHADRASGQDVGRRRPVLRPGPAEAHGGADALWAELW